MNEKYLLKLKQDMELKNLTQSTSSGYFCYVKKFLNYIGKDAMTITYADIRKYIFYVKNVEGRKPSTINGYISGIRFFFEYTLGYLWDPRKVPKLKCDRQLPVILTREQVNMLIDSMDNYKHKAITATMYSSGLRIGEVCSLRYEDILRSRKMIHITMSKSRQDRYAILSDRNLEILTEYWFRFDRPMGWLFPGRDKDKHITKVSVWKTIKKHTRELGFPEEITPHTLRHCFACHALEDGVSHTYIQQLLGHRSSRSTDIYLQMTSKAMMGIRSPFDTYYKI